MYAGVGSSPRRKKGPLCEAEPGDENRFKNIQYHFK